jgi:V8-like Glu-specific endopeptidase
MDFRIVCRGLAAAAVATLGLGATASAQINPAPSYDVSFSHLDTGWVSNRGDSTEAIAAFHVYAPGAEWLRLNFSELVLAGAPNLGNGSTLKITSLKDGYYQILDQTSAKQWQNTSAYFNGDMVLVELIAAPGTGANHVSVDKAIAGMPPSEDTICGTDDRVLSNDPFAGRVMPIGCTGWIFNDSEGCLGTAGHCMSGASVVQFNVPMSNANGSVNNPPPQDQYSVDPSSRQSVNGGIGNDWGYFGVFPNSNTGLTPRQAQGGNYVLSTPPAFNPNQDIRITGYGVDSTPNQTYNQVQQTNAGPWVTSTSTTLQYQTDTTGGNSGSPVIHEASGNVIGVHTHGGCSTSSGQNSGTSRNNTGWNTALNNPTGICQNSCPPATVTFFNGAGINPSCMTTITPPVIGGNWELAVDSGVVPGATSTKILLKRALVLTSGPVLPFGQNLLGADGITILTSTVPATGGIDIHSIPIPNVTGLIGNPFGVQAQVLVGGQIGQLCNAERVTIGCP